MSSFYVLFLLQIEIDWEKIDAKIEMEYQKERERPERSTPASAASSSGPRPGGTGGAPKYPVRT